MKFKFSNQYIPSVFELFHRSKSNQQSIGKYDLGEGINHPEFPKSKHHLNN